MAERGRGKNKQYWKDEEADALVDVLEELASDPLWKVDGGFKNNYMVEVRKRMIKKIPSFDKEVNPHIDSRIKYLKNKYNPISEMLLQSGCQWDDVEHKINCEKQWYEDWCKNHKNSAGLWNFRFPYLKKLDMVWGRDRATGLRAEDVSQAGEDAHDNNDEFVCYSSDSEDEIVMVSNGQASPTSSNAETLNNKRKKVLQKPRNFYKKKKPVTTQEILDEKLDNFTSDFKSLCGAMVSQIGVAASALTVDANKSDSLNDDEMQEVLSELLMKRPVKVHLTTIVILVPQLDHNSI
ncbi:uncharacterized protein [Rutidosis leptorrhynchoides]|uniref:uncharacterized protein n=1 Tax=Rutidosis leptorrhynchoides TaxID=125765 RepID=UPI003A9A5870